MPQPLSSRDNSLFRQVIRHYDGKQYKKGLKTAEQILRKNGQHGDTLAMKALIINSLGRSEEAFGLAKLALRSDMQSHICWHVYGLLYRHQKNFEEAIKAYKFALKLEPDSHQIQRDLAFLQIQMRDYPGYVASRLAILQSRPGLRQNWTALAIAHHLAGNLAGAESVLTTYEETLKQPPPKTDVEHSEALLYKNGLIAARGEVERALDHLEAVGRHVLDRTAWMETKARYLLQLERFDEAETMYRALVARNPEHRAYYRGLLRARQIDESDAAAVVDVYREWADTEPRADAPRRVPLDYLEGSAFRDAADRYLRRMLGKAVPSTFANVRGLYADVAKRETIQALVESYVSDVAGAQANGHVESAAAVDGASSTLELSALFFLANHYNYPLSRDLPKAMAYIERAITRVPDSVDYHMTKARIWKHSGDVDAASAAMEQARALDERDRYINSKAAKYALRAHDNAGALQTMSKFTRNETAGGALGDLHDMQCMWFLLEDGESHQRQGHLALALKRFHAIYDVFEIWQEDQFDFHSFSLRKGQIRAYLDMLAWEDGLRSHPFFARAALQAVGIYVLLSDQPQLAHGAALLNGHGHAGGGGGGTEAGRDDERKKAVKKAKRAQQKQEKMESVKAANAAHAIATATATAAATANGAANANGAVNAPAPQTEPRKQDDDPLGTKLAATAEPLKDAMKFLEPLLEFCPGMIEAQTMGFEVFLRRKKYLLALKCLLAASRLEPDHPVVHQQVIRFHQSLDSLHPSTSSTIHAVIGATFTTLIAAHTSPSVYNDRYLARHGHDPARLQAGLRVRNALALAPAAQNRLDLVASLDLPLLTMLQAKDGLDLSRAWHRGGRDGDGRGGGGGGGGGGSGGAGDGLLAEYVRKAGLRWPRSKLFEVEMPWDRLRLVLTGGLL
ncbi:MAG: N-alpha-acetyltransferase 15, NatA auxiliary subunit [Phylliscum demangeonii]|nr:MAG: N-alpha-acetyltransferase 15, NatA auxiliary subunit [Phylliscum demangeonii]